MDTEKPKVDLLSGFPLTTIVVACYFSINAVSLLILNFANGMAENGFNDAWIFALPIFFLIPLALAILLVVGSISFALDRKLNNTRKLNPSNDLNWRWIVIALLFIPTPVLFFQLSVPYLQTAWRGMVFETTASPRVKASKELSSLLHHKYDRKAIERLLDAGADINITGINGLTPLMLAADHGDEPFVDALLARGADPSIGTSVYQDTPLTKALEFQQGKPSRNEAKMRIAKKLIARGASLRNALSTAIRTSDDEELIHALLNAGALAADPLALSTAAGLEKNKLIAILLKHGANVNVAGSAGRPPLYHALFSQKLDTVRFLIANKADVNAKDSNGTSNVMIAASWKNPVFLNELIAAKASLQGEDRFGKTVLSNAAKSGDLARVKKLIELGATIDPNGKSGIVALASAIEGNNEKIVELFLEQGIDPKLVIPNGTETILQKSAYSNNQEIIRLIQEAAKKNSSSYGTRWISFTASRTAGGSSGT